MAFVGAGGTPTKVLIPAFRDAGADLLRGRLERRHERGRGGTEVRICRGDHGRGGAAGRRADGGGGDCDAARSHAGLVCRALQAGKHVFVEKPLAVRAGELEEIERVYSSLPRPPLLMAGFNRRFAPQVVKMRQLLESVRGPKAMVYTVNAGAVPGGHWTLDAGSGGGRIIGEACHFWTCCGTLAGAPAVQHRTSRVDEQTATLERELCGRVHGNGALPGERA